MLKSALITLAKENEQFKACILAKDKEIKDLEIKLLRAQNFSQLKIDEEEGNDGVMIT